MGNCGPTLGASHPEENRKSKRPPHTTSVRGNLVRSYNTDISEDYFVDDNQELGKGGCGVVVVGERKDTHAQYAIKIVDKNQAERGRLDRELKLLKDVDHTNVVRLFSVYDTPDTIYFVMELCVGGHLGNLLSRQPRKYLDEVWAKRLATQLLSAVAHIHSRGIAHRDIKLQNILVDRNTDKTAQLKLIDFGYGSRFIGALPMRTKCGTPYTTAPEVIRERYDERCDVWSVGVVLYIMLCGRRPFEALKSNGPLGDAGKAAMITNILAGRYHFNHKAWQNVSRQGRGFVKALMHPDYKQRMHSSVALEHPWLSDGSLKITHESVMNSPQSHLAVSNIKRMPEFSELQRTGMVALVFGLPSKTATDMNEVFQSFDSDSSGMLSMEEFTRAMKKVAPDLKLADVDRLFRLVDYDHNGFISYTEFLAATLDPREVDISELNKAFALFDEDGNGFIEKEEMRKVIRYQCEQVMLNDGKLMNNPNSNKTNTSQTSKNNTGAYRVDGVDPAVFAAKVALSEEVDKKVAEIFEAADANGDGRISHAEFLWAMTGLDFTLLDQIPHSGYSARDSFNFGTKGMAGDFDSDEEWNDAGQSAFSISLKYNSTSLKSNPSKKQNSASTAGAGAISMAAAGGARNPDSVTPVNSKRIPMPSPLSSRRISPVGSEADSTGVGASVIVGGGGSVVVEGDGGEYPSSQNKNKGSSGRKDSNKSDNASDKKRPNTSGGHRNQSEIDPLRVDSADPNDDTLGDLYQQRGPRNKGLHSGASTPKRSASDGAAVAAGPGGASGSSAAAAAAGAPADWDGICAADVASVGVRASRSSDSDYNAGKVDALWGANAPEDPRCILLSSASEDTHFGHPQPGINLYNLQTEGIDSRDNEGVISPVASSSNNKAREKYRESEAPMMVNTKAPASAAAAGGVAVSSGGGSAPGSGVGSKETSSKNIVEDFLNVAEPSGGGGGGGGDDPPSLSRGSSFFGRQKLLS